MANANWRDEDPTMKQIELLAKLQDQSEYEREEFPQTKGEYADAITYMIEKIASEKAAKPIKIVGGNKWKYDDDDGDGAHDWTMDQGSMMGY